MIRCTTVYQGIDGYLDRMSAAAPATNGAASLVPLPIMVVLTAVRKVMSTPGALTATYGCRSLSAHTSRLGPTAPTASTPAHEAGSSGGLPTVLKLPAAATTTTSCCSA